MTSVEGPMIMDSSPTEGRTRSNSRSSSLGEGEIVKNLNLISYDDAVKKLDNYYGIIKRQLLQYQSVTLGLFPSCSLEKIEADVRSSVYCAAAVWSLYQAYRRIDDDRGKAYELGQSCVKCMRGILFCWMRQTENLGKFMNGQDAKNALHSKFHLLTGEELETTEKYNHLQLDIVSQYLIFLVQMTTSGLQIVYSMEEVKFVQNLVYYIERAYRTPDFGMWERGSKYNDGTPELHASSIGMAKAALEAINGCNLFGDRGATWSVIFVDIDAHNRNRSIFETLLPRESSSKNVDASLLPTISFPAFATHDELLYSRTKGKILKYLKGKWGFKRFLRDGYGTILEDSKKRYYQEGETKDYDGIECDWPIFYIYMIIEGIFKEDNAQIKEYKELLQPLMKLDIHGDPVVPKYFFLRDEHLSHERKHPGSQAREGSKVGSARNLFLWGQSMWVISSLLLENLLHVNELDLIRRHLPSYTRPNMTGRYSAFQAAVSDLVVQVLLIAESLRLQAMMATYGIQTQTPHEVEPVHICSSKELVKVYQNLGVSKKLELGGRPTRPIGSLGTSKIYSINGKSVLCYPLIFEMSDFYLSHDMALLIDDIKTELRFIGKHWKLSGRPTVCLIIREDHMRDIHFRELLDLLSQLKSGFCEGVKIRTGRLQNLMASSCIEHLDFMKTVDDELEIQTFKQLVHASHGYQSLTDVPQAVLYDTENYDFKDMVNKRTEEVVSVLRAVSNLQGRTQLLGILLKREGPDFQIGESTVSLLLNSLFLEASSLRLWSVVRMCTALLSKKVESITPYITTVLVSGKQLTVGYGKTEVILDKPTQPGDIYNVFYSSDLADDNIIQAVLQQEVVLYCGKLIATNPKLFDGILNIRVGWVIRAMVYYSREIQGKNQPVEALAPNEVRRLLYNVLDIEQVRDKLTPQQSRYINGCLGKTPKYFHEKIWHILYKAPHSIKLCGHLLPYHPTISDMFPSEQNFAIIVQKLLNHVENPEYRQCIVELFSVMSTILERNPELKFGHEVDLDLLMKDAVTMFLKDMGREWIVTDFSSFYAASSMAVTSYLARAVVTTLLKGAELQTEKDIALCQIS